MIEREILFRGKRLDGDGWVYGDVSFRIEKCESIIFSDDRFGHTDGYRVDFATVGQYTGLTDKNGVKIFEGDIIQRKGYVYPMGRIEPCGERIVRGTVAWMDDGHNAGYWAIYSKDEHGNQVNYIFDNMFAVVGNVYDTPELLKES